MSEKMKSRIPSGLPALGACSLIVVFAVLSVAVFAVLSIATVRADIRLADESREAALAYYRADARCEEILARLRPGELPDGVTFENGICKYSVPITASQALFVEVAIDGEDYRIISWKTASVGEWVPDDELTVWDGNK